MKEFFDKKYVILSFRILGMASFFTLVIMTIWFGEIIQNNKFLSLALVSLSTLESYKKDYKKIPAVKRTIIIGGWVTFFLIWGYIVFLVNG